MTPIDEEIRYDRSSRSKVIIAQELRGFQLGKER